MIEECDSSKAIKRLLGVRVSTPVLTCLCELGYPLLSDWIKHKQFKFYTKLFADNTDVNSDPFLFSFRLNFANNCSASTYINTILDSDENLMVNSINSIKSDISMSTSSKLTLYSSLLFTAFMYNINLIL